MNGSNLTADMWVKLASLMLSRVILFNKRRSGEAARMTVVQYSCRPSWSNSGTDEVKNSLTEFEKTLASKLTIVQIVGKRGRIVPVILTNDLKQCIDKLVTTREECGISSTNPYIFAIPKTTSSHLRGHDCLKKWCGEAQLNSPDLVTSTKLRKYVATVCQIFNLSENEYDWLARHLGHDIRVHRDFYRLQENAVELTKVSRLLMAVDQGEAHKFAGKPLKDINIEELPNIEEERGADHDSTELLDTRVCDNSVMEDLDSHCSTDRNTEENITKKMRQRNFKGRTAWSHDEKEIMLKTFKSFIKTNTLPGKQKCEDVMQKNDILKHRKWTDLKYFIKNHLSKLTRK